MMASTSRTRRGLALIMYSEGLLVSGLLAFLAWPDRLQYLVLGILASLLLGLPGGIAMWRGRQEFGRAHARALFWGGASFAMLGLSLLLVALVASAFKQDGLDAGNLALPGALLAFTIIMDAGAMVGLTGRLLVGRQSRWGWALAALTVGAVSWFSFALARFVDDATQRARGIRIDPVEAPSYVLDFQLGAVKDWVIALLMLRLAFWPTLYHALVNVSDAEAQTALAESARGSDDLR